MPNPNQPLSNESTPSNFLVKKRNNNSRPLKAIDRAPKYATKANYLTCKTSDNPIPHISMVFPRAKNICGEDNRESPQNHLKEPYRFICELLITTKDGLLFRASGFLISPRVVVTAGHCVFPDNEWVNQIEVIPAANRGQKPFGSAISEKFRSTEGWVLDGNQDYDYGAILLDNDILYNHVQGYFKFKSYNQDDQKYRNSGYPHDRFRVQKYSEGKTYSEDQLVKYYIDTYTGNSGSPLYLNIEDSFTAVGVHTYGNCPNHAVQITDMVIINFRIWIEESLSNI